MSHAKPNIENLYFTIQMVDDDDDDNNNNNSFYLLF